MITQQHYSRLAVGEIVADECPSIVTLLEICDDGSSESASCCGNGPEAGRKLAQSVVYQNSLSRRSVQGVSI